MRKYVAVDVGGTKIAVGIGEESGGFLGTSVLSTDTAWSQDKVLDHIAETVNQLVSETGVERGQLMRLGLGSPGPLDGPRLLETSNLHSWMGLNWETGLASRLNRPVSVQNDATAAGLGEWLYGAGRGTENCIYVTVSTGIGAGIVASGRLYAGSRGNAGEFGHIVMDPSGPECPAGHKGCLESMASGTAIRRQGQAKQPQSAYLTRLEAVETKDVFDGYEAGDAVCRAIIEEAADRLGLGLSYLIDLFNPEKIILGGGVATHAPATYRERVWNAATLWSLKTMAAVVELVPAQLGGDSGLKGALAVAVTAHRE